MKMLGSQPKRHTFFMCLNIQSRFSVRTTAQAEYKCEFILNKQKRIKLVTVRRRFDSLDFLISFSERLREMRTVRV